MFEHNQLDNGSLPDFEYDYECRSSYIHELTVRQQTQSTSMQSSSNSIPKTLVQFWDDDNNLPEDVRECMDSWGRLEEEGFSVVRFSDESALDYISSNYSERERTAFLRCRHPAMRSDYFRMCFILCDGGFYVDCDDVLIGDGWKSVFLTNHLKLQPLCFDLEMNKMISTSDFLSLDTKTENRVFYLNNNPLAAPARHPMLTRALKRSTEHLLNDAVPNIQNSTGPGNMTVSLATHAHHLDTIGAPHDFEFILNWDKLAFTKWNLSYRNDARNWRLDDASGF